MRGRHSKAKDRRSFPLGRVCLLAAGIVLAVAVPYSAAGSSGNARLGSPAGNPFDRGIVAPSGVVMISLMQQGYHGGGKIVDRSI